MKRLMITEFRRNLKSLILWTSIVAGMAALMLLMYPAFKDTFAQLEDLLSVYPEEFLEAFGMGEGGLDMSDFYGWFGVEGYLFVNLIGGSYAAILGGSILSKEEDDKTIEFLLSKPISRSRILFGKAGVVALNLILLMIFASISFFISVFVTKSRKVLSIGLGFVIGLYVVDLISKLTEEFEYLKYITPYEYINAVTIVNDEMIKPLYLLISILMIGLSFFGAWYFYRKKDITA